MARFHALRKTGRTLLVALLAALTSAALVFSVTVANLAAKGDLFAPKKYAKTEIGRADPERRPPPPRETERRKPARKSPQSRSPKMGPRQAMNLGLVGAGGDGAALDASLLSDRNSIGGNVDADQPPSSPAAPTFQVPQAVRDMERDAVLRLAFCVDERGEVFNVQVVEESPRGCGLAQAGIQALSALRFSPARKQGRAVPFCGMEQPFEVRFRDR